MTGPLVARHYAFAYISHFQLRFVQMVCDLIFAGLIRHLNVASLYNVFVFRPWQAIPVSAKGRAIHDDTTVAPLSRSWMLLYSALSMTSSTTGESKELSSASATLPIWTLLTEVL